MDDMDYLYTEAPATEPAAADQAEEAAAPVEAVAVDQPQATPPAAISHPPYCRRPDQCRGDLAQAKQSRKSYGTGQVFRWTRCLDCGGESPRVAEPLTTK